MLLCEPYHGVMAVRVKNVKVSLFCWISGKHGSEVMLNVNDFVTMEYEVVGTKTFITNQNIY